MFVLLFRGIGVACGSEIDGFSLRNDDLLIARGAANRAARKAGWGFELLFAIRARECDVHTVPLIWIVANLCACFSNREEKIGERPRRGASQFKPTAGGDN